jgi:hypothetical protein
MDVQDDIGVGHNSGISGHTEEVSKADEKFAKDLRALLDSFEHEAQDAGLAPLRVFWRMSQILRKLDYHREVQKHGLTENLRDKRGRAGVAFDRLLETVGWKKELRSHDPHTQLVEIWHILSAPDQSEVDAVLDTEELRWSDHNAAKRMIYRELNKDTRSRHGRAALYFARCIPDEIDGYEVADDMEAAIEYAIKAVRKTTRPNNIINGLVALYQQWEDSRDVEGAKKRAERGAKASATKHAQKEESKTDPVADAMQRAQAQASAAPQPEAGEAPQSQEAAGNQEPEPPPTPEAIVEQRPEEPATAAKPDTQQAAPVTPETQPGVPAKSDPVAETNGWFDPQSPILLEPLGPKLNLSDDKKELARKLAETVFAPGNTIAHTIAALRRYHAVNPGWALSDLGIGRYDQEISQLKADRKSAVNFYIVENDRLTKENDELREKVAKLEADLELWNKLVKGKKKVA